MRRSRALIIPAECIPAENNQGLQQRALIQIHVLQGPLNLPSGALWHSALGPWAQELASIAKCQAWGLGFQVRQPPAAPYALIQVCCASMCMALACPAARMLRAGRRVYYSCTGSL